jgi:flagellar hook-associated protein 2
MSTAGISFGGLASGLDTRAIIAALVAVERRPITALETKKTSYTKQKSLFGDLKGLLDKLETAAKAIKTTTDFLEMKAVSDDESILTASASGSATPGSYSVTVLSLAKAQVNSAARASASAVLDTAATLQIDTGGNTWLFDVANGNGEVTLDSIAAAINAQDDANDIGVRAEVIDTNHPDPSKRYELVVRSKETGSANGFAISVDSGNAAVQTLIDDITTGEKTAAQDAVLEVNSITVYRSTNTISDLFAGLTLDLKSADPGTEVTVAVSPDGEETSKKVKDLVDAYNGLVDFFAAQNALDAEGKAKGPLFGDSTLRSMRSSLRSAVGGVIGNTGNPAFQLLSQVGITADTQGRLTFEQSKFEEALATDEQAVTNLFANTSAGLAQNLLGRIDLYTDSVDGLIKTRSDGFDRLVKQTQGRIDQAERRLTLFEQQLEVKYANLETLLGRLQSQGAAVGNIAFNTGK